MQDNGCSPKKHCKKQRPSPLTPTLLRYLIVNKNYFIILKNKKMKISSKQANLLAKEIVRRLKNQKVDDIPDHIKIKLMEFKSVREDLMDECKEADKALDEHDKKLKAIIPNIHMEPRDSYSEMLTKLREKNIPRVGEIEDEIILKSMFASEDDLNKFVDAIVKKHAKQISRVGAN